MLILSIFSGLIEGLNDALRAFFMTIDQIVYWFIEIVFQLIMDLANTEIFTQTTIDVFAKRIYVILGLVMVFKMMISFVQILIDPDTMTDKEKGVGAVLKRVIISLILIVLVPSIFSLAREVQSYILPVIPRVIMGVNTPDQEEVIESRVGRIMAWYSFLPFFGYEGTCNDGSIISYYSDDGSDMTSSDVVISSVNDAYININRKDNECGGGAYHYVYSYKWIISTIVGAYLLYTLVTVAVLTAKRAIKLGICEFIAPIPIASYIDPKTSKSTFDKWVSTSIKVYLDLFIQLIVVYFVAFVFTVIAKKENVAIIVANTGSFFRATLVILFIIVGLVNFVREFPKFLSDLLGLGTSGDIASIFKGAGWKQVGGTLAAPAAAISAGLSASKYSRLKGEVPGKAIGRGLSAGFRGAMASFGAASSGKGLKDVYGTREKVHGASMRRINSAYAKSTQKNEYEEGMKIYQDTQPKLEHARSKVLEKRQDASESWSKYIEAKKRGDNRAANIHKMNYDNSKAAEARYQKEVEKLEAIKKPIRPTSYGIGKISAMAKNFAGVPVPNSKTYTEAAKIMYSGKKIFNDAKTKVTDDPTLIKDRFEIKDKNGRSYGVHSFAEVYAAHKQAGISGSAKLDGVTYDSSELETIYGEALKKAGALYVNGVQAGTISNGTMKQDIAIFNKSLENEMVIDSVDKESINYDKEKPGDFFKSADEVGRLYDSRAQDLRAVEENK